MMVSQDKVVARRSSVSDNSDRPANNRRASHSHSRPLDVSVISKDDMLRMPQVVKHGVLLKRSDYMKSWRPRFLVLLKSAGPPLLVYYHPGENDRPKKVFALGQYTVVPMPLQSGPKRHVFVVKSPVVGDLYLAAEEATVAQDWVECLRRCLRPSANTKPRSGATSPLPKALPASSSSSTPEHAAHGHRTRRPSRGASAQLQSPTKPVWHVLLMAQQSGGVLVSASPHYSNSDEVKFALTDAQYVLLTFSASDMRSPQHKTDTPALSTTLGVEVNSCRFPASQPHHAIARGALTIDNQLCELALDIDLRTLTGSARLSLPS